MATRARILHLILLLMLLDLSFVNLFFFNLATEEAGEEEEEEGEGEEKEKVGGLQRCEGSVARKRYLLLRLAVKSIHHYNTFF